MSGKGGSGGGEKVGRNAIPLKLVHNQVYGTFYVLRIMYRTRMKRQTTQGKKRHFGMMYEETYIRPKSQMHLTSWPDVH